MKFGKAQLGSALAVIALSAFLTTQAEAANNSIRGDLRQSLTAALNIPVPKGESCYQASANINPGEAIKSHLSVIIRELRAGARIRTSRPYVFITYAEWMFKNELQCVRIIHNGRGHAMKNTKADWDAAAEIVKQALRKLQA